MKKDQDYPAPVSRSLNPRQIYIKRAMDIIGGILGIVIFLLVSLVIGAAIKLTSSGPIFFCQERIGRLGRPFIMVKFRTMYINAERDLDLLVDFTNLVEPVYKLNDDPRVTKVGRFLRRWSLDELPQFWNVLKGDMSLVGPRPEERRIAEMYNHWQQRRLAVKPGMTGPMQVHGRGDLKLEERVRLEIDYIEKYSLLHDLALLIQTIPAVIKGKGAR